RGAFLRGSPLQRHVEDGGDDSEPELAACSTAGDACHPSLDAERAKKPQAVPQPEGDALEDSADESAAIVAELEPNEGTAGGRVGVRCPFSCEVGKKGEALDAGWP